ncbi:conserved hypothetical protein [Burkholderia mallei PRL-20]|uniref:Uncharacterized protein n=2 Tax=pseudomallei group TaxID=111527 RepID=A2S4Z5_BURM9|nr:hypothetical protein BMASAVP1_A2652 [Burkholderia mallei SAVP1]ABN01951.1 hypothetical protein BMA10229_A1027 [Burkholderia mallei NCTC 10229]ABO05190.1 hypothetical protein BMA10247_2106 [Burkholderia mallei NCTC 10247]EDK53827.1 hypothetical protein BMAFMH_0468 [Burkholderia mallei FMH]EDK58799.1 hypothetical protein BMAJHU_0473 [Burkholderia mallei JHU]EDK83418.1 hypothetical protein BMA721280_B0282 [Burkholderia mallei 2002721280]EDO94223.1 hypothetical protein BURPSPAST_A1245 [Burkhol
MHPHLLSPGGAVAPNPIPCKVQPCRSAGIARTAGPKEKTPPARGL